MTGYVLCAVHYIDAANTPVTVSPTPLHISGGEGRAPALTQ